MLTAAIERSDVCAVPAAGAASQRVPLPLLGDRHLAAELRSELEERFWRPMGEGSTLKALRNDHELGRAAYVDTATLSASTYDPLPDVKRTVGSETYARAVAVAHKV